MKKGIIIGLVIHIGILCHAQTFNEWFRQKATQKKYLIEQIAALKVYLDYVQKGYSIAQKGLNAISDIKTGDFNIHHDFFQSLKEVNHNVENHAAVADIVTLQLGVMKVYESISKQVKTNGQFNAEETDYIRKVFEAVLNDCVNIIFDLTTVITPNVLGMRDDERLKRIDNLYENMQEAYAFTQSFATKVKLLQLQRVKEENDIRTIPVLNEIKPK